MYRLTHLIFVVSRTWWLFALLVLGTIVSFRILFDLEDQFERITSMPVLDTQNDLTVTTLMQQLPLYEGEALSAYLRFALFDFVFPFVAALFLSVVWVTLLRLTPDNAIRWRLLRWKLPLAPFFASLFDCLENMSLVTIIIGEGTLHWVAYASIVFKRLKLGSLTAIAVMSVLLVMILIGSWIVQRYQGMSNRASEKTR